MISITTTTLRLQEHNGGVEIEISIATHSIIITIIIVCSTTHSTLCITHFNAYNKLHLVIHETVTQNK